MHAQSRQYFASSSENKLGAHEGVGHYLRCLPRCLKPFHCLMADQKKGPEGPKVVGCKVYLPLRLVPSSESGGRTTRRPSSGNALRSTEKPLRSLCGKATPI